MADWKQVNLLPWGRVLGFLQGDASDCRSARLVCRSWAERTLAHVDELWLCGRDLFEPCGRRKPVTAGKKLHLLRLDGGLLAALQALPDLAHLDLSNCGEVKDVHSLRNCTSLTHLRLGNGGCTPADQVAALLPRHTAHLVSLDARGCARLSDAGIGELCGLSALTALNLSGTNVTDGGLVALTRLASLTRLGLQRCYHICDSGLRGLTSMTLLRHLDLQGTPVSGESLQHIPSLTCLHLDLCVGLSPAGVAGLQHLTALTDLNLDQCGVNPSPAVLQELVNVRNLDISGNNVTDSQLTGIQSMTSLTSLNLRNSLLTDTGLASFRLVRTLTKLDVSHNPQITDAGLSHLSHLPLRHLELAFCGRVTVRGLSSLSALGPSLAYLSLAACTKLNGDAMGPISALKSLTSLDLRFLDFSSAAIAALRPLPSLTTLLLQHNVAVTAVPSLPSLTHLDLEGCQNLGTTGLRGVLGQWPCCRLTSLSLAGCWQLSANCLAELWRLGSLTHLNLACCKEVTDRTLPSGVAFLTRLAVLDLGGCSGVTDSGLLALRGLTHLRQLGLSWCSQVTDPGLAVLSELPLLKDLDLSNCNRLTGPGILSAVTAMRRLIKLRVLSTCLSADALQALRRVIPSVVWSDGAAV